MWLISTKKNDWHCCSVIAAMGAAKCRNCTNIRTEKKLLQCNINNANSKSARSLKYSTHSMALQFVERRNAIFFTTQQLSKLLLISKRSPKELDTIEMNNILKFQHNSWTINRDHIKFKFSFKLGWGFLWLMLRVGPLPPQKHMAKKAPTNTVEALNSALLNSGKALFSGQNLGDQLFLCSKSS